MEGTFTVGMIMAFQGVLSSFSAPAATFISAGQTIQEMRTQMERVEDVMEYREDDCYKTEVKEESFAKLSGNIERRKTSILPQKKRQRRSPSLTNWASFRTRSWITFRAAVGERRFRSRNTKSATWSYLQEAFLVIPAAFIVTSR